MLCDLYIALIILGYVGAIVWRRIRMEERRMREHFGCEYLAWRRRTKCLVPYLF